MACICQNCKRDFDCGTDSELCELCKADKSVVARLKAKEQESELESAVEKSFILISGSQIVRSAVCFGWKNAVEALKPGLDQRIAVLVDIPRD